MFFIVNAGKTFCDTSLIHRIFVSQQSCVLYRLTNAKVKPYR